MQIDTLQGRGPLTIYHLGPPLTEGPLPSVFYFTLTGKESLELNPFNQPVHPLVKLGIRVFSFTLPAHGNGFDPHLAMSAWAASLEQDSHFLDNFLSLCQDNIDFLIANQYVDPSNLATAGLSRGGFIATHLAAKESGIKTVLGFAPLTTLPILEEFKHLSFPSVTERTSLSSVIPQLTDKTIRYYIGNRDTRVGTSACFDFIKELTDQTYLKGKRSPQIELIISPSIGHKGHGTSPEIFNDGARWLAEKLKFFP